MSEEVCEKCSGPLEAGYCPTCGSSSAADRGFGESAPSRAEFRKIIGRIPSTREHNYFRSLFIDDDARALHEKTLAVVDSFALDERTKASVAQRAEVSARRLRSRGLSVSEAVVASVRMEACFLGLDDPVGSISKTLPSMGYLRPLVMEVLAENISGATVTVAGEERKFRSWRQSKGPANCHFVSIPIYSSDDGSLLELRNMALTRLTDRRGRALDLHTVKLKLTSKKSFRMFKLMKEVLVDADVTFPQRDPSSYLRRYSISRLPLTERLMREAGCLSIIHSQYARLFEEGMKNAMGTSPKTVAERALLKADAEVFSALSHDRRARAALLAGQVGVRITNGLVVRSELKAWED